MVEGHYVALALISEAASVFLGPCVECQHLNLLLFELGNVERVEIISVVER